jgi:hypothetical protein
MLLGHLTEIREPSRRATTQRLSEVRAVGHRHLGDHRSLENGSDLRSRNGTKPSYVGHTGRPDCLTSLTTYLIVLPLVRLVLQ